MKILNKKTKKQGFTLVEVMVVIGIIVVLASVLVPKLGGYVNEVKKVKVVEQARKVVLAAETFIVKTNNSKIKKSKINEAISLTDGLLEETDVDKLEPNNTTVEQCYNILEPEKYKFTIDKSGNLTGVIPFNNNSGS